MVVISQVASSTDPSATLEEVDGCHLLLVKSVRAASTRQIVLVVAVDQGQSVPALSATEEPSMWCQLSVPLCYLPRMEEAEAVSSSRVVVRCTAQA